MSTTAQPPTSQDPSPDQTTPQKNQQEAEAQHLQPPTTNTTTTIFAPSNNSPTPGHATQYTLSTLTLSSLSPSPTTQFHTWYTSALSSSSSSTTTSTTTPPVYQPETCTLSTASLPSGRVSARTVFLKELSPAGHFIVYSNWATSRKAADIASNPFAALTFWWREVERQVRVEGRIERIGLEESQRYFDTRVRESRIGAWASEQSCVLEGGGREGLEERVREVERRFEGQEWIPVPGFWGGARVVPERVEFWQGRVGRLHDRFLYRRRGEGEEDKGESEGEGEWIIERLSP